MSGRCRGVGSVGSVTTPASLAWSRERDRLVGIAYRMLGDFGAAEDVVSDVAVEALRVEASDSSASAVRSWEAWLTTVCVRRSIDRLRQVQAMREDYPGPWLPEPVATDRLPEDVAAGREMLSIAVLHLAEQLEPDTRAAIVLHRAFGMSSTEIASVLERSPAAVRQLISRGEKRLHGTEERPSRAAVSAVVERLVHAVESGDVGAVATLLTDDAVLWADGGGIVKSARNPIFGPVRIARFFAGVMQKIHARGDRVVAAVVDVNGEVALSLTGPGAPDVIAFELREGRVCGVRRVSNPEKLTRVW